MSSLGCGRNCVPAVAGPGGTGRATDGYCLSVSARWLDGKVCVCARVCTVGTENPGTFAMFYFYFKIILKKYLF